MVTALFGGLAVVIAALGTMIIAVTNARKEAASRAAETAAKVTEIHNSVNGANTALLERVERLTAQVAALTNAKRDLQEARVAEGVADAKRTLTIDDAIKRDAVAHEVPKK